MCLLEAFFFGMDLFVATRLMMPKGVEMIQSDPTNTVTIRCPDLSSEGSTVPSGG
jgi:hypothetical protein